MTKEKPEPVWKGDEMTIIKDIIEGLERICKEVIKDKSGLFLSIEDTYFKKTISKAIQILQSVEQTEGELGEKINSRMLLSGVDIYSPEYSKVIKWYNKMHDIATPIIAKYKLENDKLKTRILEMGYEAIADSEKMADIYETLICARCGKPIGEMAICSKCEYEEFTKPLELERDKAKLRIEELENELEQERVRLAGCLCVAEGHIDKTVKQGVYGWSLPYERIKELQQKLEEAEGELPEKREIIEHICPGKHGCRACHIAGGNKGIELATFVIAKYKLRIEKLEKSKDEILRGKMIIKGVLENREKELQSLKDKLTKIYISGYEKGHDDTVESCYGMIEEKAEECLKELGVE